ncbi:MAG: phosphoribosyl-AMP cyclohydrolase [Eubacteriales bacterium]|nr:phosphoribosyl-AMP cyclohydrolase [Eubacteriales bacterium]
MLDEQVLAGLDFEKGDGLMPVITVEAGTGTVLMLAYMNRASLDRTLATGLATYYSRSRKALWVKGETSGHYQHVCSITADCDADTLLLEVVQEGVACHTGAHSCFHHPLYRNDER